MKSVFMRKLMFVGLIGATILLSCEPKPNTADLVKKMVVVTDYNDTVNFSKKTTYYLALDTIIYFNTSTKYYPNDTLQCTTCSGYNNYLADYPTVVTDELKNKMNLAGY